MIPIDLWSWVSAKPVGLWSSPNRQARLTCATMASAMIQCRTIATGGVAAWAARLERRETDGGHAGPCSRKQGLFLLELDLEDHVDVVAGELVEDMLETPKSDLLIRVEPENPSRVPIGATPWPAPAKVTSSVTGLVTP